MVWCGVVYVCGVYGAGGEGRERPSMSQVGGGGGGGGGYRQCPGKSQVMVPLLGSPTSGLSHNLNVVACGRLVVVAHGTKTDRWCHVAITQQKDSIGDDVVNIGFTSSLDVNTIEMHTDIFGTAWCHCGRVSASRRPWERDKREARPRCERTLGTTPSGSKFFANFVVLAQTFLHHVVRRHQPPDP